MNSIWTRSLIFTTALLTLCVGCKNDEPTPTPEFQFPSKVIHKITVDNSGTKWFATEKGVISYDGKGWTSYSDQQNLSNKSITDLALDLSSTAKKIWLGSNFGLSSFEFLSSGISFSNFNKANSGILSDNISALAIDANNVKYIGTSEGLSILKGNNWTSFLGRDSEKILLKYKISAIATAKKSYVYTTTLGGGVSRYKTDAISGATTFNLPWAAGLKSDTVFTVIVTEDSCQWYGTAKGAAYHSSPYAKSDWTSYSRRNGLICDSVYAIAKDLTGGIWLGTHKGVSKLTVNETDTIFRNFTTKDGLVDDKINTIAVDLDGSVWFGTDKGISQFNNNKWTNY